MDTSHYEYCFQREARGIATSTKVNASGEDGEADGGDEGSRLRVGDPLVVHVPPQQFLHTTCHIHRVVQIKVTVGVQDRVGAGKEKGKMVRG